MTMEKAKTFKKYFSEKFQKIRNKYLKDDSDPDNDADNQIDPEYYIEMAEVYGKLVACSTSLIALEKNFSEAVDNGEKAIKKNSLNGTYYLVLANIRLAYIYKRKYLDNKIDIQLTEYKNVIKELKQAIRFGGVTDIIKTNLKLIEAYKAIKNYKKAIKACLSTINYINAKLDLNKTENRINLAKIYSDLGLIYTEITFSIQNDAIPDNQKLAKSLDMALESFFLSLQTHLESVPETIYLKLFDLLTSFAKIEYGIELLENLIKKKYKYHIEPKYDLLRFYLARLHLVESNMLEFFVNVSYISQSFYKIRTKKDENGIPINNPFVEIYDNLGKGIFLEKSLKSSRVKPVQFSRIIESFIYLKRDILQYKKIDIGSKNFTTYLEEKVNKFIELVNTNLKIFDKKFAIESEKLTKYLQKMAIVRAENLLLADIDFDESNMHGQQTDESETEDYYSDSCNDFEGFTFEQPVIIRSFYFQPNKNNQNRLFNNANNVDSEIDDLAESLNQSLDNIYETRTNYSLKK